MRSFLAALMLVLPLVAARAQTVRGAGARPCTDWSQARGSGGRAFEAEQWMLGYMSGVNFAAGPRQGNVFRILDEKGAFAAVDAYCSQHPSEMLWNALKSAMAGHGV